MKRNWFIILWSRRTPALIHLHIHRSARTSIFAVCTIVRKATTFKAKLSDMKAEATVLEIVVGLGAGKWWHPIQTTSRWVEKGLQATVNSKNTFLPPWTAFSLLEGFFRRLCQCCQDDGLKFVVKAEGGAKFGSQSNC